MTPEECSAEILRQLISQALLEANATEIVRTAITIPVEYSFLVLVGRQVELFGSERPQLRQMGA